MLIQLKDFAGLAPKLSDRSLPPNHATVADNCQLYSGEVRGLRQPLVVANLSAEVFTVKRAYRLNDGSNSIADATGDWIAFDDNDVNFVRGALKNDSFDRYYAAGGTQQPVVATAAEWAAGSTPWDLGVPAPTVAPTVVAPASGSVDETRAYVYTFVNIWGEESAPSPASSPATGDIGGTWELSNMQVAYPVAGNYQVIDKIRVYRTVTGTNSVDYRFVAEIDPPANTYSDAESVDTVSLNESIPSIGWGLPPSGLQAIVNMANGIMVGFVGRDIYFSEPYRPHTWPPEYVLSVDAPIVGLGVYQAGAVVCTTSNPYVATGMSPESIILARLDDVEPCQSLRSIINGIDGVMYASQNGMILVNQSGATNITQPLVTRNEWRDEYFPGTAQCATDGSRVLSFYNINQGWIFTPGEPLGYLVDLNGFVDVESVQSDPFTGEAYFVSQDQVYLWNPTTTTPLTYTWKSKVFETPYPVNMGAYRIQYEDVISESDFDPGTDYSPYNTSRFSASTQIVFNNQFEQTVTVNPLNTLNLVPVNGVRVESGVTDSPPVVQYQMPIGGSPLINSDRVLTRDQIRVKIYGDGTLRYEKEITSQDMQRLPSGYKADKWQIELETAQNIYSFKMAGTAVELKKA